MSRRFVAPMTTTPSLLPKPSISTSSWLSVCSRSSWLSDPPRALAMASISSMKIDGTSGGAGLGEQLADTSGADPDVLLDELGARHREERHVGLGRDGLGEHRLAGAGRAVEHHAADGRGAEPDEAARIAQELDGLGQLELRLVGAGDVGQRDARPFSGDGLIGPAAAVADPRRAPGTTGCSAQPRRTGARRGRAGHTAIARPTNEGSPPVAAPGSRAMASSVSSGA